MADKNVHSGHRQRLRDRAASEGLDAFEPHQVMELLLFYAIPRQDTSEIAHLLIRKFKTVQNVLTAPKEELTQVPGVGERVADWLQRVGEAVGAYGDLRAGDRVRIGNYGQAFSFCEAQRKQILPGQTYQLCLTPSGKIQIFAKLCDSTAWGEAVSLKNGLEAVLSLHARCAIVVVFTDQAEPEASEYDRKFARHYDYILHAMGSDLLDVLIVGPTQVLSMKQSGALVCERREESAIPLAESYLRENGDGSQDPWLLDDEPENTEY